MDPPGENFLAKVASVEGVQAVWPAGIFENLAAVCAGTANRATRRRQKRGSIGYDAAQMWRGRCPCRMAPLKGESPMHAPRIPAARRAERLRYGS
jgi:hypothetical protein